MSLISSITEAESNQLTVALVNAVNDSITAGKDEPDIVANLTHKVPTYLKSINRIGNYDLSVGGVFIHQTPRVNFHGMDKDYIELGDLLLISTVISKNEGAKRKALLLQAKMFDEIPIKTTGNDDQHNLYRYWPVFEYVKSGRLLSGKKRCLGGYDLYNAAKYLLLRENVNPHGGWPHWIHSRINNSNALTAHPTSPLATYQCFVSELFRFVLSDAGKSYHLLAPVTYRRFSDEHSIRADRYWFKKIIHRLTYCNGWSLVINDLLKSTVMKTAPQMGVATGSGKRAPRGVNVTELTALMTSDSTFRHFMDVEVSDDFPPNIDEIEPGDDEPEGSGISVIEFVLTESENPKEIRPDEHTE